MSTDRHAQIERLERIGAAVKACTIRHQPAWTEVVTGDGTVITTVAALLSVVSAAGDPDRGVCRWCGRRVIAELEPPFGVVHGDGVAWCRDRDGGRRHAECQREGS